MWLHWCVYTIIIFLIPIFLWSHCCFAIQPTISFTVALFSVETKTQTPTNTKIEHQPKTLSIVFRLKLFPHWTRALQLEKDLKEDWQTIENKTCLAMKQYILIASTYSLFFFCDPSYLPTGRCWIKPRRWANRICCSSESKWGACWLCM